MDDAAVATTEKKPHVICLPLPAQSHIQAMLKLAELLHYMGLQVTFVNTENIHNKLLKSGGVDHSLRLLDGFRFETFNPDGLSPRASGDDDHHVRKPLLHYVETTFLTPFLELVTKLATPPTCIISDGIMSLFTIDAGKKLGIPVMLYWTFAACGFMGIYQIQSLVNKGLAPLKDESYLTNGYLNTIVDWIPGMEGIRLKDLNTIPWTTDPDAILLKLGPKATQNCHNVSHNIIRTFDALEASILDALSSICPRIYTVGPLQLLRSQIPEEEKENKMLDFSGYNLRKEEPECFHWLRSKEPNSVIYVNFGSTTEMPQQDLIEFAWGLADSNHYFLWIIRSDLVVGDSSALPPELEEHLKKRGFIASWCSQEKVLNHPSVGGFLTHCGWGSTIESLSAGVPMICWPYLYDQVTNCRYICKEWEVGLEMGKDVKREEVGKLVQELMGKNGHGLRLKAMEWKEKALTATAPNGSSTMNINNLVQEIIVLSRN